MSDKEKIKTLHWLVALLIVALIAAGVYIINNELKEESKIVTKCNCNETNDNINQEQEKDNSEKLNEKDFIRKTEVVLVNEPECTGSGSSLIASIEPTGNISISQSLGAVEIEVGNAKYLYSVGWLACDSVRLYYITEDNQLYAVDNPNAHEENQKGVKVTESSVVEFLGDEIRNDSSYLKILLENGEMEYINYFTPEQ